MRFSPPAIGLLAAVVTVTLWTGFIVIARASAQRTLSPFDIALLRISVASLVLLPWGVAGLLLVTAGILLGVLCKSQAAPARAVARAGRTAP